MRTWLLKRLRKQAHRIYGAYYYDGAYFVGERKILRVIASDISVGKAYCLGGCMVFKHEDEALQYLYVIRHKHLYRYIQTRQESHMRQVRKRNARIVNRYLRGK